MKLRELAPEQRVVFEALVHAGRLSPRVMICGFARVEEVRAGTTFGVGKVRRLLRELDALDVAVEVKRGAWAVRRAGAGHMLREELREVERQKWVRDVG